MNFVEIYGSVYKLKDSAHGTTLEDILLRALELYRLKQSKGVVFGYIHAWKILKDVPSWRETWKEARWQSTITTMKCPALSPVGVDGLNEATTDEDFEVVEPQLLP